MTRMNKIAALILILIVGACVQVLFSFADCKDTPGIAVAEFSKAYFKLDKSMAKRICVERLNSGDVDLVDKYVYQAGQEAKNRGFNIKFMQNKLYDIEIETISKSDNKAQIRITGKRRVAINPVFPIISKLFNIGETYTVDEIINVVKEGGKWKVCGNFFSFPAN
uniref:Uncharacterized protein n=1 Tax=Candidatus Desulfatibia profunda TaxID=2841695 RepID=A0A8J6TNR7_9BACT|nr:hypothetical protein [Candidatus Desulfatibia profunda]